MQQTWLRRARRFRGRPGGYWTVQWAGVVSALIVPALLLVLGMIVHLLGDHRADDGGWLGQLFGRLGLADDTRGLLLLVGIGLALGAAEAVTLAVLYRAAHRAALSVAARLSAAIVHKAFALGGADLLGGAPDRAERLTGQRCEAIRRGLVAWWRAWPRAVALVALLVALAFLFNPLLALTTMLLAAMIALVDRRLRQGVAARRRTAAQAAARQQETLRQTLKQLPLAIDHGLQRPPGPDVDETVERYAKHALRANAVETVPRAALLMMVLGGAGLLIYLVGFNVLRTTPTMRVAESVVTMAALVCAYFPAARIRRLIYRTELLPDAEAAAAEVFTFLERLPMVAQVPTAAPLGAVASQVVFQDVALANHRRTRILDGLTLTIPAQSRVALVCARDQAALVMAGLLMRFYDPTAGQILFDGRDLRLATLDSLRRQTAWVPGSLPLLDGTVAENIGCGEDRFNLLQVTDAAKTVHAHSLIQKLPQGFSTIVGPQGFEVSSVLAFLIGLARAALSNPSVVVIQEPPPPADPQEVAHLDEALRRIAIGRTCVILPNRLATFRGTDRVFVIRQGKLHAEGPHGELLKASEIYRHLIYTRFPPFRQSDL